MEEIMKDKLALVVKTIDDMKGNDIQIINVSDVNPLCEYFVICDANNTTQTSAIAARVRKELLQKGFDINHIEGEKGSKWVLLDANDIIIHVFYSPERAKYSLDKLWADQEFLNVEDILKEG